VCQSGCACVCLCLCVFVYGVYAYLVACVCVCVYWCIRQLTNVPNAHAHMHDLFVRVLACICVFVCACEHLFRVRVPACVRAHSRTQAKHLLKTLQTYTQAAHTNAEQTLQTDTHTQSAPCLYVPGEHGAQSTCVEAAGVTPP
jgi:hypothetical protein